jgi:hypothetical protein
MGTNSRRSGDARGNRPVTPPGRSWVTWPAQHPSRGRSGSALAAALGRDCGEFGAPYACVGSTSPGATYTATCTQDFSSTGTETVTANYSSDASFIASSGSLTLNGLAGTTTVLSTSPSAPTAGASFDLVATVASAGGTTPTGTVDFTSLEYDPLFGEEAFSVPMQQRGPHDQPTVHSQLPGLDVGDNDADRYRHLFGRPQQRRFFEHCLGRRRAGGYGPGPRPV